MQCLRVFVFGPKDLPRAPRSPQELPRHPQELPRSSPEAPEDHPCFVIFFRHRSTSTVFEKRGPKNSGQSIAADFLLGRQSISCFSRVLFCSFVLFRFCTSDTGSGIGNGQRGGPSVRRKWTSGRGSAQMSVGLLILRVSLPLLSFSLLLHCRHRSTPSIWPPKGPRATPKELPRISQEHPRAPKTAPAMPW